MSLDLEHIQAKLAAQGWVVLPNAVPATLALALRRRALNLLQDGALVAAQIGSGNQRHAHPEIRGDLTYWLEPEVNADDAAALAWLDGLRINLGRRLFMPLPATEAHYALYPPGRGYDKHLDCPQGSTRRLISLVLYLNPDWNPLNGGQLHLFPTDSAGASAEMVEVQPELGTLVLFISQDLFHAVAAPKVLRLSLTAWFGVRQKFD